MVTAVVLFLGPQWIRMLFRLNNVVGSVVCVTTLMLF